MSEEEAKLLEELKRLLREGREARRRREFDEAKELYKEGKELAVRAGWEEDAAVFEASILLIDKKFEDVISFLSPIVEKPALHLRGDAYLRIGWVQDRMKLYEQAILSYQKALGDPNYDTPGKAWHNMGITHRLRGEFEEALQWLRKAREWYLANEPRGVENVDYHISSIRRQQELRKRGLNKAAEEVGKIASLSTRESTDPLIRIRDILAENRNKVGEYAERDGREDTDILAILKGWSSSIPIISAVDRERFGGQICQGGGYFVKTEREGIVIDPGLDFLANFGTIGFHIKEVSQVIVSHNHIDHCADLIRLADLEHQWRLYDPKAERKPNICFHLDIDTHEGHRPRLLDTGVDNLNVRPINSQQPNYSINEQVTLKVFHTEHDPDNRIPDSIGFVLNLIVARDRKRSIGYTSDTAFFKRLPKYLSNCDIIIAHFSYAEPADYEGKESHTRHLGYTGLLRLIKETEANLYVISEFWGGRGDCRIELVQKLLYDLKRESREVKIIPGDVSCIIGLRKLDIRCSRCGEFVPYEEIFVTAPEVPFGKLRYLCKNCLLG
ncbi:hypothetical protein CEE36_10025 [candidate division TA06 bacterium B3_TA06]|uniref:Metallo-beta-lactamase domain-containing protein n=1 Tax=candidate division TA06 bacterium B3_TA06 TaxID=2012487 RepID=A0A532UY77_UNCT6|nr:MAG: hypothetical protein CEE36_10025 [candidate division TA06 bacterium B3_TA06]